VSRTEHATAQTREVTGTVEVLEDVLGKGVKVKEVAHDNNVSVSRKIEEKGLINSYDTWHGMVQDTVVVN
jgi:hypothetical protein